MVYCHAVGSGGCCNKWLDDEVSMKKRWKKIDADGITLYWKSFGETWILSDGMFVFESFHYSDLVKRLIATANKHGLEVHDDAVTLYGVGELMDADIAKMVACIHEMQALIEASRKGLREDEDESMAVLQL